MEGLDYDLDFEVLKQGELRFIEGRFVVLNKAQGNIKVYISDLANNLHTQYEQKSFHPK